MKKILKPQDILLPFKEHRPDSRNSKDVLRHYLADIVFGANDGIITTFAIVSGVEGARLPVFIIIVLGFVNLLADGISMGASNYLSIRTKSQARGVTRGRLEPFYHAFTTFTSFVIFGAIPLLSFLVPGFVEHPFLVSSIMTAVTLFLVGALRVYIVETSWWRGGLEILAVGGAAALISYGVGYFLAQWIG